VPRSGPRRPRRDRSGHGRELRVRRQEVSGARTTSSRHAADSAEHTGISSAFLSPKSRRRGCRRLRALALSHKVVQRGIAHRQLCAPSRISPSRAPVDLEAKPGIDSDRMADERLSSLPRTAEPELTPTHEILEGVVGGTTTASSGTTASFSRAISSIVSPGRPCGQPDARERTARVRRTFVASCLPRGRPRRRQRRRRLRQAAGRGGHDLELGCLQALGGRPHERDRA
jgi:hypothetical protein